MKCKYVHEYMLHHSEMHVYVYTALGYVHTALQYAHITVTDMNTVFEMKCIFCSVLTLRLR